MIRYHHADHVARITFDSPATSNAITYAMMQQYIDALEAAQNDRARFLIIDANGPDFTLGRDQKEKVPGLAREDSLRLILRANAALRAFDGVSIALIQGRALGFGSGIALHSTLSIAADTASFGFDEINHGLAPLVIVAYAPYFLPPRVVQELVITGRKLPAAEAREIGIASRVVPADALQATADELIADIGERLPSAVRLLRRYHEAQAQYPGEAVLEDAIQQLDQWITQGKP
ncbi:enoyl-CoA hydratase/isomerase family protein [Achromobacter marplatensis]|uniref:enoyl-CoA hydratase/isomerase family protein n=1 Tax=Achromobacter marplatensis TaxID=470868 RepID=UPI0028E91A5D|nr:enoyl-CoA hydratase/isomerase family protein [Achromobacter marplatensis]